jgi:hypothetical protein
MMSNARSNGNVQEPSVQVMGTNVRVDAAAPSHPAVVALITSVVDALGPAVEPVRLTVVADYGSLTHTPSGAADEAFRARAGEVADALAERVFPARRGRPGALLVTFRGVQASGSVHVAVRASAGAKLSLEGLADVAAERGAALLDGDPTGVTLAFYPSPLPGPRPAGT